MCSVEDVVDDLLLPFLEGTVPCAIPIVLGDTLDEANPEGDEGGKSISEEEDQIPDDPQVVESHSFLYELL